MAIADKIFKNQGQEVLLSLMKTMDPDELFNLFSNEWDDNQVAEGRDESYKWGDRDIFVCVDLVKPWNSFSTCGYKNLTVEVNPIYWVGRKTMKADDMEIGTYFTVGDDKGLITDVGVKVDLINWEVSSLRDMQANIDIDDLIKEFKEKITFVYGGTEVDV